MSTPETDPARRAVVLDTLCQVRQQLLDHEPHDWTGAMSVMDSLIANHEGWDTAHPAGKVQLEEPRYVTIKKMA